MTRLVLVRHAPAGVPDPKRWPDDRQRPVTQTGIKKFKKAAEGLGNLVKPDYVLTSPLSRAMTSADLLNWDGGWPTAVADDSLQDEQDPADVIKAIRAIPGKPATVGLVGHGPSLEKLAQYLLGSDAEKPVDFQKGGAALIETPKRAMKPGSGTLQWAMRRKELKRHRT